MMKKRDLMLAAGILLLAVLLWVVYDYVLPKSPQTYLRITVAGEVYGTYSLDENQEIPIGKINVCVVEKGVVTMKSATCPDHLCIEQRPIDKEGGTIVCLPNRVVLEIATEKEQKMDAVTGWVVPGKAVFS